MITISVMRLATSLQSRRLRMMKIIEVQCLEVFYKNILLQLLLLLSLPKSRNLRGPRKLKRSL
jgi:Na+-transporting methylmalonyl-CoA/oxaloacetate decarboxylase beta subunit